jgi:hypothetical protein
MFLHDDTRLARAWGPWFSHEYIAYHAALSLDGLMGLPLVPVRANPLPPDPAWPLGPNHVDEYRESFRDARALDPLESYDYGARNGDYGTEPPPVSIEPWKVLVLYSTEPDLHPDCDLFLDKRQKITGGSHGWRHMQFRVLGQRIGMVRESFRYHRDRALKSFGGGDAYWGWRYLSRCCHYLADMGSPFHVKALPGLELVKGLVTSADLKRTASAVHKSYEIYAERRFREGFPAFSEALERGAREGAASGADPWEGLDAYISRAEKRCNPIFYFFKERFGAELIEAFSALDHNAATDASMQVNNCATDAARVIFRTGGSDRLAFLDRVTEEILLDVGRMLGALLAGFILRN